MFSLTLNSTTKRVGLAGHRPISEW